MVRRARREGVETNPGKCRFRQQRNGNTHQKRQVYSHSAQAGQRSLMRVAIASWRRHPAASSGKGANAPGEDDEDNNEKPEDSQV